MKHTAVGVEKNKHRKAETLGISQPFHQIFGSLGLLLTTRLSRVIVDMDVDIVIRHHLGNVTVVGDEVGEAKAPRAPVATHLTHHELLALRNLGVSECFVDLLHRVYLFIINFFNAVCASASNVTSARIIIKTIFLIFFSFKGRTKGSTPSGGHEVEHLYTIRLQTI